MISISHLQKVYRDTVAVDGLSFTIEPGQILGLVGPNGAGKTTTLRSIAGIIAPTRGTVSVAGHDVTRRPIDAKKALAYVPDDPRLFEVLTVWEHLQFAAKTYGVAHFDDRGRLLLEQFDLTEKRDALGQELSRGMRQKVAICCAYLHEPQAILFDEPLTGLDPRAIRTLKNSIMDQASRGAAVIISSHLLSLIEDLCTHLLILHKGRSLFLGSVDDARTSFEDLDHDASLEEVFFRATEGIAAPSPEND